MFWPEGDALSKGSEAHGVTGAQQRTVGEEEAGEGPDSARAWGPHSGTRTLSQRLWETKQGLHLHVK